MHETIQFRPVNASAVERWSRPARFDFLHRLPTAPIADSELLHLSHYCPVVITLADDGPRVLILLDPDAVQSAPVAKDGRWCPPYAPIALRSLPFWPGERPKEIHVTLDLAAEAEGETFSLRDIAGNPGEQFAKVMTWIERLQHGMRRLSEAAKVIVAADILTPLVVSQPDLPFPVETDYLTVSPEKFQALAPARAAALSTGNCLPLDIVAACLFSRRLLARRITLQKIELNEPAAEGNMETTDLMDPIDHHVRLDCSPLFSFELFERLNSAVRTEAEVHAA